MSARVLIAGYYGFGNAGDEAILHAMAAELLRLRPELELSVLSGVPSRTEEELRAAGVEARGVEREDPQILVEAVRESDLVILGGGGLFQDYWQVGEDAILTPRQGGLPYYVTFPLLAGLLARRSMIYAVGVGPLATDLGRRLTRAAFRLAQRATVRDDASAELVRELGVEDVEVTADPAFALDAAADRDVDATLRRAGVEPGEPYLAVILRAWDRGVEQEEWIGAVAAALDRFAGSGGARVLFLPFQNSGEASADDDVAISRRVTARMERADRALVLEVSLPPEIAAALAGRAAAALAMRFHGALLALRAGVPTVNLAYDPKGEALAVPGVAHRILTAESWTEDAIFEALSSLEEVAWDRDRRSGARSDDFAAAARRNAAVAVELLEAVAPRYDEARAFLHDFAVRKALAANDLELRVRELSALEPQLEAAREALSETMDERDRLSAERDALRAEARSLSSRLRLLEDSAAVRIVFRFWGLVSRLFPEGSRRRRIYSRVRSLVLRPLGMAKGLGGVGAVERGMSDAPDVQAELQRFEDRLRSEGATTVHAMLSGTRLLESEGQRPTQLVRELVRRREPVVFLYWRWSQDEWCPQDRLDDGILQIPLDVATRAPEMLAGAFRGLRRLAWIEFPHPSFFELTASLNATGWYTLYDVLDHWKEFHAVGQAIWYDEDFERHLITAADAVFAINRPLAERVRELGGEWVEIVPNGLLPGIEEIRVPRRLERGDVTLGYFGHLTPAWFDWDLVAEVARRRPGWRIYLIGYGGDPPEELPETVELLGKQPQHELSGYAENWDVATIPFRAGTLAAGADPIKTYEYLAMGLPVVATGVHPPAGGEEFVERVEGVEEFLAAVERATRRNAEADSAERRRSFAATCTWGHRLDAMLETVEEGRQRVAAKRHLFADPPTGPADAETTGDGDGSR